MGRLLMATEFPTRQVVARHIARSIELEAVSLTAATLEVGVVAAEATAPLKAMVLGVDRAPRAMPTSEVATFGDPFTTHLLLKGVVPLTAFDLDAAIRGLIGGQARPVRKLYAIAEGAAFQGTVPTLPLNARLVFTWQKDAATDPDLLLSTTPDPDDPTALLQVIAWSEPQGVFHFFERRQGTWFWAGNSLHALQPESRGQGPFDSHINGALVMKELRFPWVHWHSMARSIERKLLFPTLELQSHPLFAKLEGAEILEPVVQRGVRRWTRRRLRHDLQGGQLVNLHWYMRQVLWTTSVNLTSTDRLALDLQPMDELALPPTFFFDVDGLSVAITGLSNESDILPQAEITVPSTSYRQALLDVAMHVEAQAAGPAVPGDTDFAFLVPERAFEDTFVLEHLITSEVLSPKLALCLLMVDFSNPVFSPDRAALLDLFPPSIAVGNGGAALDTVVLATARNAAPSSATEHLVSLWDDDNLLGTVKSTLHVYIDAVKTRLNSADGVIDLLKLADSRREAFRGRTLNEFRHTTAVSGATIAHLAMHPNGTIFQKTSSTGEKEQ